MPEVIKLSAKDFQNLHIQLMEKEKKIKQERQDKKEISKARKIKGRKKYTIPSFF